MRCPDCGDEANTEKGCACARSYKSTIGELEKALSIDPDYQTAYRVLHSISEIIKAIKQARAEGYVMASNDALMIMRGKK